MTDVGSLLIRTQNEIYTVDNEGDSYYVTNTLGDGELWRSIDELIDGSMLKLNRILQISLVTHDTVEEDKVLWRKEHV